MNLMLSVGIYEYRRNVFKKSFIFSLLGLPLMIAFSICLGLTLESLKNDPSPIGFVDKAGILVEAHGAPGLSVDGNNEQAKAPEWIFYPDEQAAQAALRRQEIQAYYQLPDDYPQTRLVEEVYLEQPGDNARKQLFDSLRLSLLADRTPEIAHRISYGSQVIVRSMDGRRQTPADGPSFGMLMPLFITIAFLVMLLISAGYMLGAVSDEKENRTLEVLITSVSPTQLMTGKILAVVAISLTLLCAWITITLAGVFIGNRAGIAWFQDLSLDWRAVLATLAIALPAFVLAGALMTTLGAMLVTMQETQTVTIIFIVLHALPFYLSWAYLTSPHSPLAITLSLLPFSALVTVGMRNLFSIVPVWQVFASMGIQTACAICALWVAGRTLRTGMLSYQPRLGGAWRATWLGHFHWNK